MRVVTETDLLRRITVNPEIFAGKPVIRGRRLAVEHVLGLLAAGAIHRKRSWLDTIGWNLKIFTPA